jgi:hypothetical protein
MIHFGVNFFLQRFLLIVYIYIRYRYPVLVNKTVLKKSFSNCFMFSQAMLFILKQFFCLLKQFHVSQAILLSSQSVSCFLNQFHVF